MAVSAGIPHVHLNRRTFFTGLGAAAVVGSAAAVGIPTRAEATGSGHHGPFTHKPAPKPILYQDGPTGAPAPFDLIHWTLPGPDGATTQILELESFGLDAHRSTIGDYAGFTAYAVVAGTAKSSEGDMDVELDIRVMSGKYIGEDGKTHVGTFGFF